MDQLSWFVLVSNVAFLLPAWVLAARTRWTYAWEACDFVLIAFVSATYHACDAPDLDWCATRFTTLRFADLWVSFHALVSLASPWIGLAWGAAWRLVYRSVGAILVFLLVAYDGGTVRGTTPYVAAYACFGMLVSVRVVSVRAVWKWFLAALVWLGVALALVSVSSDDPPGDTRYQSMHGSGSHIAQSLAAACIYAALPVYSRKSYALLLDTE